MSFDGSGIEGLLSAGVEAGTFHGVSAMVVGRDGVLYSGHAGQATAGTMFRNASMTKAVATTCALQLVEQGRLGLDDPVESVLPEFDEIQVLEGFDGDVAILRPPATKPTFRQLMTHTSGCGYLFFSEELAHWADLHGVSRVIDGKRAALHAPLVADPGTVWSYGVSTDWLGLAVEAVSGVSLGTYARAHVYEPLGMVDSTFTPGDAERARLLPLRARAADGGLEETALDLPAFPEWEAGGHGSYGTIEDYGRFVQAWLRDGELDGARVLSPDTVALAFEDHLAGASLPEVMKTTVPELTNDVPRLPLPQGWGLGFHLTTVDVPGMRSAGTGDWAGIFNSYYWIDRSAGIGGILMTQILPFFDLAVVSTLVQFEAAAYAALGAAVV